MLHSYVRNYLHITWSTDDRARVFHGNTKIQLKDFFLEKAKEMNTPVLSINIQPEHIHILVDLPSNLCLADLVQKIKGASSHWINEQKLINAKFSWQRGYGAFSVNASQLEIVKKYVQTQDAHHKRKKFVEEYQEWKDSYGFFDD